MKLVPRTVSGCSWRETSSARRLLVALKTQNYLFWISALLLALIKLPDFSKDPISRIAGSIEKAAGLKPGEGAAYSRLPLKPKAMHDSTPG